MNKIIIILLLFSQTCLAQEAVFLNQKDSAPFSGYLINSDEVKSLRNDSLAKSADDQIITSLNTSLNLYQQNSDLKDKQLTLLMTQNQNLSKTLSETQILSNWEKVLYFGSGIVITGLAISAVHSLYR